MISQGWVFPTTGFTGGGEMSWGYNDPRGTYNGWLNSPGHYANMIDPSYQYIGVAQVGMMWVTDFANSCYANNPSCQITTDQGDPNLPVTVTEASNSQSSKKTRGRGKGKEESGSSETHSRQPIHPHLRLKLIGKRLLIKPERALVGQRASLSLTRQRHECWMPSEPSPITGEKLLVVGGRLANRSRSESASSAGRLSLCQLWVAVISLSLSGRTASRSGGCASQRQRRN